MNLWARIIIARIRHWQRRAEAALRRRDAWRRKLPKEPPRAGPPAPRSEIEIPQPPGMAASVNRPGARRRP